MVQTLVSADRELRYLIHPGSMSLLLPLPSPLPLLFVVGTQYKARRKAGHSLGGAARWPGQAVEPRSLRRKHGMPILAGSATSGFALPRASMKSTRPASHA
jgi:hypothetical protein